jgi:hypothetical protein
MQVEPWWNDVRRSGDDGGRRLGAAMAGFSEVDRAVGGSGAQPSWGCARLFGCALAAGPTTAAPPP